MKYDRSNCPYIDYIFRGSIRSIRTLGLSNSILSACASMNISPEKNKSRVSLRRIFPLGVFRMVLGRSMNKRIFCFPKLADIVWTSSSLSPSRIFSDIRFTSASTNNICMSAVVSTNIQIEERRISALKDSDMKPDRRDRTHSR